jgi:5-methylcytosine-specific restriction protein B
MVDPSQLTRDNVLQALRDFDAQERSTEALREWETRGTHKFAVEHGGRRYPVKHIVARALGVNRTDFSGGAAAANGWLERIGFTVVPLTKDGQEMASKTWVIYVGKPAADNFVTAMQQQIWGAKDSEVVSGIRKGDRVLFVFRITGFPNAPAGFAQGPATHFVGTVQSMTECLVTKDPYESTAKVWPDDVYPHRFTFEVVKTETDVVFDYEHQPAGLIQAASASSRSRKGKAFLLEGEVPVASPATAPSETDIARLLADFSAAVAGAGLHLPPGLVTNFFTSTLAKPFVILTGLSGSGKTQLARKFGQWLGQERLLVVAVRPDWTGPEALLGYEDALRAPAANDPRRPWMVPEVLAFLLRAARSAESATPLPYVLVLDEMNLAHVERYFADVLSGMESGEGVLPDLEMNEAGLWVSRSPGKLPWPRNVVLIGTVNVDETTYVFSPKVLDRAFTIEFRVATASLPTDLSLTAPQNVAATSSERQRGVAELLMGAAHALPGHPDAVAIADGLRQLHARLVVHNAEFGFRTWLESARLAAMLAAAAEEQGVDQVLDTLVMQKILPRIHGARRKTEPLLLSLSGFCAAGSPADADPTDPKIAARLPASWHRLGRMVDLVRKNQFVTFAE